MTSPEAATAWDSMTDQQRIEWLATVARLKYAGGEWGSLDTNHMQPTFSPLTDWNHWRQVEEKVMMETGLMTSYIDELVNNIFGDDLSKLSGIRCLIEAELPTRAKALYLAYQALP